MKNERITTAMRSEGFLRRKAAVDGETVTVQVTLRRQSIPKLEAIGAIRGTDFSRTVVELMNDGAKYRKRKSYAGNCKSRLNKQ